MPQMTKTISSHEQCAEEDYIDIDPDFMSTSINAPSRRNSKEFEFKLCPNSQERCSYNSPADELFYKGILLPLHLHPRIETIQQLLLHERNPHHTAQDKAELEKESMSTHYNENDAYGYPIMPAQCRRKSYWSKKFKGLGSSALRSKLKASHTYLKCHFAKPTCSNDWCKTSSTNDCADNGAKRSLTKNIIGKVSLKSSIDREKLTEEDELTHRKSFSSVAKLRSTTRSNSSSSSSTTSSLSLPSLNLNELYIGLTQPPTLRRSNSINSEMESSIHGAITYCKKSQGLASGRKSVSSLGFYSF